MSVFGGVADVVSGAFFALALAQVNESWGRFPEHGVDVRYFERGLKLEDWDDREFVGSFGNPRDDDVYAPRELLPDPARALMTRWIEAAMPLPRRKA